MTSGDVGAFDLLVSAGRDVGLRVRIEPSGVLVGRARDAHLVLTDVSVSRRHLQIRVEGGAVRLTTCEGAEPPLVDGRSVVKGVLKPGDEIRIGETVLAVVASHAAIEPISEVSDVATLLGARTEDGRGFAAVFALAETLDALGERGELEVALREWSSRYLGARATTLVEDDRSRNDPSIRITGSASCETLSVPMPGHGTVTFELSAPRPPTAVEQQRRLAVVAARVVAAALTQLQRLERVSQEREVLRARAIGSARSFLGETESARAVTRLLPRLAASDASLLILGETGSGKSFVARLIHDASRRAKSPFRAVNCAALPESLIEAELFGHERGAFTGATTSRIGALESAEDGTLFLDEIGEVPLASQTKLLRVLEQREFERLGSNRAVPLRARVIAATNRPLEAMVADGRFRADLYYRLSVVTLDVPPLRDRRADLPLLALSTLADFAPSCGRRVEGFSKDALAAIIAYDWPGNVRELRNVIERALVLGDGLMIEPADLPDVVRGTPRAVPEESDVVKLPARLADLEERAIRAALTATGGNRTRAAALLGINRVTLYKKLREEAQ